ncbi:MAG: hypothetical protein F2663_06890 [Actinobacteria bacterium]|uniref:Unannotated protein n=1 Tax=freshwater metagenome TaxID=449393 RepID=A0A6J6PRU3_9ZZZZ|nr:hypothetical protein [Actinomycetota bacterium]
MAELPKALPPETRTVGQLVAETIKLYQGRFWLVLPLGLPLALLDQAAYGHGNPQTRALLIAAFAPLLSLAYAQGAAVVNGKPLDRATAFWGVVSGTVVMVPAALLFTWFALAAIAYLGLVGLVVPVAVIERRRLLQALRRAGELGRADYIHSVGSLATLVIVYYLTRNVLLTLLHGQADNTIRIAAFLADVVLAPLMVAGGALLYVDQEARFRLGRPRRRRRSKSTT